MVDTEKVGPCIKAETRVTPVTSAHTLPATSQPQRDIQLQKAWCLVVHWGLKTISVMSRGSGGLKSQVKAPAESRSGEVLLPGSQMAGF